MKRNKEYWKKRCELAEDVIHTSGIVAGWPFVKWEGFINHKSTIPWFDAPPPPQYPVDRSKKDLV